MMLGQHPDWGVRLRRDPYRAAPKPAQQLHTECATWCTEAGDVARGLRWCKYYELARLAWRDWHGHTPIEDLLRDWSQVAEVLIAHAFAAATRQCGSAPGTLFALGKLGACELNISSDVDLVYVSDDAAESRPEQIVMQLTTLLAARSADGLVFRVDWELRPEGQQGAAAPSFRSARRYYEERGVNWERLAWLRARPIAGDVALGQQFLADLAPFRYRRHTSMGILEELHAMKRALAQQRSVQPQDIKLGRGGIRELEFVVNTFQLLHGGQEPTLQTTHTFSALRALATLGLLPSERATALTEAYAVLRRIENMLQIAHERQTHTLPNEPRELRALAERCHYTGPDPTTPLLAALRTHRALIHDSFHHLFGTPYETQALLEAVTSNLHSCHTLEEQLDGLVWSKQRLSKPWIAEDLAGRRSFPDTCRQLSRLAEVLVGQALRLAWGQCHTRHPAPPSADGSAMTFAVVALGSAGAFEMDWGSDLDLLFLYEGNGPAVAEWSARLAQRLLSYLDLHTRYGRLYPVDTALRPAGHFGVLVTHREVFARYYRGEAELWEHLAVRRARPIAGDPAFGEDLLAQFRDAPFAIPCPADAKARIHALRQRAEYERAQETATQLDLKFGPGGSADVETLMHYLQLRHGESSPELHTANTWIALEVLGRLQLQPQAQELHTAYTWLRRLLAYARLLGQTHTSRIDIQGKTFAAVCEMLQLGTPAQAATTLQDFREFTRNIYTKIMT